MRTYKDQRSYNENEKRNNNHLKDDEVANTYDTECKPPDVWRRVTTCVDRCVSQYMCSYEPSQGQ